MTMFEVGQEYWLTWGSTEEQTHSSVKIISQEGSWLQVEPEKAGIDPMINLAAPLFISARKRDRALEEQASARFAKEETAQRAADAERIRQFRDEQSKGIV